MFGGGGLDERRGRGGLESCLTPCKSELDDSMLFASPSMGIEAESLVGHSNEVHLR